MFTISIPAKFTYTESYIPPRCRKPRNRDVDATCDVTVRCVTSNEAPVAMYHTVVCKGRKEYRWFNNSLYCRATSPVYQGDRFNGKRADVPMQITHLKELFARNHWSCKDTHDNCKAERQQGADLYLIIDDKQVWKQTGEPRYVIMTFGLGHNHSSTALMIDNRFNENISHERYFSALQRNEAIAEAQRIAAARGDTNAISSIRKAYQIKVLIPEAVQCNSENWGGKGNPIIEQFEKLTEVSNDAGEAAALLIATTMATIQE